MQTTEQTHNSKSSKVNSRYAYIPSFPFIFLLLHMQIYIHILWFLSAIFSALISANFYDGKHYILSIAFIILSIYLIYRSK